MTSTNAGSKIQKRISKTENGRKLVSAVINMRNAVPSVPFKKSATGVNQTESASARAENAANITAITVIGGIYFLIKLFRDIASVF